MPAAADKRPQESIVLFLDDDYISSAVHAFYVGESERFKLTRLTIYYAIKALN